ADETLSPARVLVHESCFLEHADVLLHGRERHVVSGRQLRHGRFAFEGAANDVPARRIRERLEHAIDVVVAQLVEGGFIYSHLVVGYAAGNELSMSDSAIQGNSHVQTRREIAMEMGSSFSVSPSRP